MTIARVSLPRQAHNPAMRWFLTMTLSYLRHSIFPWLLHPSAMCTSLWACLVARKWAEVRKWGHIIAYFPIYPNTRKKNEKTPFPFLFSLLHNHFLTFRVIQLILWSCKSHL